MINRILIRIKVVQMMYSYLLTSSENSLTDAKKELTKSLEKGYELYNYLLILMIELTQLQDQRLDQAMNKYLPTDLDLNPNTKFVNNQFIKALADDEILSSYLKENPITWKNDDLFLKLMLDKILRSDIYADYMEAKKNDYASDCDLWRNLMKKVILNDEDLAEILESKSVYWNDDLEIISTFVIKTIKRFEDNVEEPLLPMYKNDDDKMFGEQLFVKSVNNREECNELIDKFIKTENWDTKRIALMDRVIMGIAITEILNFPSIPITVSLNEYIEIAKYYSTPKSSQFINGILNSIVNYLKETRRVIKN